MGDTTKRAIQILSGTWGAGVPIGVHDVRFLLERELPGEKLLETCARLAGADVRGIEPFNYDAIRKAAAEAEIKAARRL